MLRPRPAAELVIASNFPFIEAAMTAKYPEAFIEQALVKVIALYTSPAAANAAPKIRLHSMSCRRGL